MRMMVGGVGQPIERSPGYSKPRAPFPNIAKVTKVVIPALGSQKKKTQKFEVILGYLVSLRPTWDTRDPASEK